MDNGPKLHWYYFAKTTILFFTDLQGMYLQSKDSHRNLDRPTPHNWTPFLQGTAKLQDKKIRFFIWCNMEVERYLLIDGIDFFRNTQSWQHWHFCIASNENKIDINNMDTK